MWLCCPVWFPSGSSWVAAGASCRGEGHGGVEGRMGLRGPELQTSLSCLRDRHLAYSWRREYGFRRDTCQDWRLTFGHHLHKDG